MIVKCSACAGAGTVTLGPWRVTRWVERESPEGKTKIPSAYARLDVPSEIYLAVTGKWIAWAVKGWNFDTAEAAMEAADALRNP